MFKNLGMRRYLKGIVYIAALIIFSESGGVLVEVTCLSHCTHTARECPPALQLLYLSVAFRAPAAHLNHQRRASSGDLNAAREQSRS